MPEEEKKKAPSWVDYLSQVQNVTGLRDNIQPFEPGTRTLQGWGAEHDFMRWYLHRLEQMAAQSAMGGSGYHPRSNIPQWRTPHGDRSWMTSFGGSGYPAGHPYAKSSGTSGQAPAAPAASGSNLWHGLFSSK